MRESDLEKQVIEWVESQGGIAVRVEARGVRGWPDLDVRLPNGRAALIELKRPGGGKVSPHQVATLDRLARLGHLVFVADSLETIRAALA